MYDNYILEYAFVIILLTSSGFAYPQSNPDLLSTQEKQQVIDSIIKKIDKNYVYPEVAIKMKEVLTAQVKMGTYDAINDPASFAAKLRENLTSVSHDRHLNITFDPGWVRAGKKVLGRQDSLDLIHKDFPNARADNFGFKEARILEGNIGYLNITKFYDPALGGETAAAAMSFLANTDALVIDLRENGGGYGDMVQLVTSYLFDTEPVLILDMYSRENQEHRQDWTLPYVPGKRMPEKAVYILTGSETFSAAESFAYFLKNQKRATLIGDTTGGGAHPILHVMLTDRFTLFVPYGRPVDPVTKTDWENIGVIPDIAVPAKDALFTAQLTALERLLKAQPENANAAWALAPLKARQHPVALSLQVMKTYSGSYSGGIRKLLTENGKLYFQRTGQLKYELVPLTDQLFMVAEIPYLRIKIQIENGKVTGFSRLYNDGSNFTERRDP